MTEPKLTIFGFEYFNQPTSPNLPPTPVLAFKAQWPSGAQAQVTWPADNEDMEYLKELLDRYESKILTQLDPNAQPGFVPDGLDNNFRPDKEQP